MAERTPEQALAWESRWRLPAALANLAGVVLLIASLAVIAGVSGKGEADVLRSAHEHASRVTLGGIFEALGFICLVGPLVYLFRAGTARSGKMRARLIGVIVAAPLFLAVSGLLNATTTGEAANSFTSGTAKSTLSVKEAGKECRSDRKEKGAQKFGEEYEATAGATPQAECVSTKVADNEASNAVDEASTRGIATGLGLAGRLGLAFALFYSCLYGMRLGLLTRFWGSLGMGLGIAALLLFVQFALVFFIYFGLLLMGWLPGGRPPAWAAGKAIPWPTPGEQVAARLEQDDEDGDGGREPTLTNGNAPDPTPRRKRKQRD